MHSWLYVARSHGAPSYLLPAAPSAANRPWVPCQSFPSLNMTRSLGTGSRALQSIRTPGAPGSPLTYRLLFPSPPPEELTPLSIILFSQHGSESWTGSQVLQSIRIPRAQGPPLTCCLLPSPPPPRELSPLSIMVFSQHDSETLDHISGPSPHAVTRTRRLRSPSSHLPLQAPSAASKPELNMPRRRWESL